jgi:hypothetical protein
MNTQWPPLSRGYLGALQEARLHTPADMEIPSNNATMWGTDEDATETHDTSHLPNTADADQFVTHAWQIGACENVSAHHPSPLHCIFLILQQVTSVKEKE